MGDERMRLAILSVLLLSGAALGAEGVRRDRKSAATAGDRGTESPIPLERWNCSRLNLEST